MKKEIHPKYFPKAKVTCACGNSFSIGATKEKMEVDICSKCHPFYTGSQGLIDTAGRAEKFKTRTAKAAKVVRKKSEKKTEKAKKKIAKREKTETDEAKPKKKKS